MSKRLEMKHRLGAAWARGKREVTAKRMLGAEPSHDEGNRSRSAAARVSWVTAVESL
jgi:hypothetical protein